MSKKADTVDFAIEEAPVKAAETAKFTKQQLVKAAIFKDRRDAISAVLAGGGLYTMDEAVEKLNDFMTREERKGD